jgi:lipopolysaccharide heptosyltransferase I
MRDILFIKTSSLGDVIHHMPALTEARLRLPRAHFAWVVEEDFAPLVALHEGVEVIPVAGRRWRRGLMHGATYGEMRAFACTLRSRRWDVVIDTQGLMFKSALIACLARGERHGYDAHSIKERLASLAYDVHHKVDRGLHAIARNRALTGLALGYTPEGPVDYGFDRARLADTAAKPYAILLHASARVEKLWPEQSWVALGKILAMRGVELVLPWGSEAERARSERIAAALANARVPERMALDPMARLIAGASFVVGVDTGLVHLAAALGVPLAAIFIGSEPGLTGPMGAGPIAIVGGKGTMPAVAEVADAIEKVVR